MNLLTIAGDLAFECRKNNKTANITLHVPEPFHGHIIKELNHVLDKRLLAEPLKPQTIYTTEGVSCIIYFTDEIPTDKVSVKFLEKIIAVIHQLPDSRMHQ